MKRLLFASCCLLAAGAATLGASGPAPDSIKREIAQANATLQLATLRHDAATVRGLISDDYIIYFGNGTSEDHDGLLADVADPATVWQKNDTEHLVVRDYNGDTAIVTAALHQRYAYHKKLYDYRVRFSDVWVKLGGKWRYVSAHASSAVNTPGFPKS
jgi:hypothetical protein